MAIRIPWDIYESALLLDTYLHIENGDVGRSEALEQISVSLRKLALNRGYEIDDVYRNVNGMILQMQKLIYIYTKGKKGMAGTSKIFSEICKIYEENPSMYKNILLEAKKLVGNEKMTNQSSMPNDSREKFQEWLISTGLAPVAATGYGGRLNRIESYALTKGYCNGSIYEIDDEEELFQLYETLNQEEGMPSKYRDCLTALRRYITYKSDGRINLAIGHGNFSYGDVSGEQRQLFQEWLVSTGLAPVPARDYGARLNRIEDYAFSKGYSSKSIYEMKIEEVVELYEVLNQEEDMPSKYRDCLTGLRRYITYKSDGSIVLAQTRNNVSYGDESGEKRAAYQYWLVNQGMVATAARNYGNWLNRIDQYSIDNEYSSKSVYEIESVDELISLFKKLNEDRYLVKEHRDYLTSMKKYIAYRSDDTSIISTGVVEQNIKIDENLNSQSEKKVTLSDEDVMRYNTILLDNFEEGLVLNAIRLDKFRMLYEDAYDINLTDDDDKLISILKNVGTYADDRIYPKHDSMQSELIEQIITDVIETLQNGAKCVYLSCIYERWQDELANQLNVYNQESMSALISAKSNQRLVVTEYVAKLVRQKVYPEENVISCLKESHFGVNYQYLHEKLWYIPIEVIKRTLVTTPGIVLIDSETYFYALNFPASAEELHHLAKLMHEKIAQKGFIVSRDIYLLIMENCTTLAINTEGFKDWAYRNILKYLLRDEFEFGGSIVSEKGKKLEMNQVYSEFCKEYERMTLEDLNCFSEEVGVQIYWDSVLNEMVRINANEFVRRDQIHFCYEAIDNVINEMCPGDYLPLKEISLFLHFPAIEVPWNIFVLESYLLESKHFSLLHASFSKQDVFGLVLRKKSNFSSYEEVIIDLLAHDSSWSDEKEALELIVAKGCQARRRWENFDKVLQKANNYREELLQKGE